MGKFDPDNPEHQEYVQGNCEAELNEIIFFKEPGVHEFYCKIVSVESYHEKRGSMQTVVVSILCETSENELLNPQIVWKMLDTNIKSGRKESPRDTNHRIAWGEISSWLRTLCGISISGYRGMMQKAFKDAIWFSLWGKQSTIHLIKENTDIEVVVPQLVGKYCKFRVAVTESNWNEEKQRYYLDKEFQLTGLITQKEFEKRQAEFGSRKSNTEKKVPSEAPEETENIENDLDSDDTLAKYGLDDIDDATEDSELSYDY